MPSDTEDVIEDEIVEHPDVDVFADWAEITFGVVNRMRGRAMTEPQLDSDAQPMRHRAQSVVDLPQVDPWIPGLAEMQQAIDGNLQHCDQLQAGLKLMAEHLNNPKFDWQSAAQNVSGGFEACAAGLGRIFGGYQNILSAFQKVPSESQSTDAFVGVGKSLDRLVDAYNAAHDKLESVRGLWEQRMASQVQDIAEPDVNQNGPLSEAEFKAAQINKTSLELIEWFRAAAKRVQEYETNIADAMSNENSSTEQKLQSINEVYKAATDIREKILECIGVYASLGEHVDAIPKELVSESKIIAAALNNYELIALSGCSVSPVDDILWNCEQAARNLTPALKMDSSSVEDNVLVEEGHARNAHKALRMAVWLLKDLEQAKTAVAEGQTELIELRDNSELSDLEKLTQLLTPTLKKRELHRIHQNGIVEDSFQQKADRANELLSDIPENVCQQLKTYVVVERLEKAQEQINELQKDVAKALLIYSQLQDSLQTSAKNIDSGQINYEAELCVAQRTNTDLWGANASAKSLQETLPKVVDLTPLDRFILLTFLREECGRAETTVEAAAPSVQRHEQMLPAAEQAADSNTSAAELIKVVTDSRKLLQSVTKMLAAFDSELKANEKKYADEQSQILKATGIANSVCDLASLYCSDCEKAIKMLRTFAADIDHVASSRDARLAGEKAEFLRGVVKNQFGSFVDSLGQLYQRHQNLVSLHSSIPDFAKNQASIIGKANEQLIAASDARSRLQAEADNVKKKFADAIKSLEQGIQIEFPPAAVDSIPPITWSERLNDAPETSQQQAQAATSPFADPGTIASVTSSDRIDDAPIINTGTTSIDYREKAALPLTPAEQKHQEKISDVSHFEEISQFAKTMADSVDEDIDLILGLQPGSIDELNAATADLRTRFKVDYLPDLAELKVALSPFSPEDQLHNQHVQDAFFAYGEYLDACDELKQAISDAYARFGTVVADTDPDIPPPPTYSPEEETTKKFRRDAAALELDARQLRDFLQKAARQVDAARSPQEMDQLIREHIDTYNRFNAAVTPALNDLQEQAQYIRQLNGSQEFETDRAEGLAALDRVEDWDVELDQYTQTRESAVERINKAVQLCGPFIRQAKKVIAEFTSFTKKAEAPESVQNWPFEIAEKDLHAIRDRYHQTVAIYDGIKNDHGDGAITRAAADVLSALIRAFATAFCSLDFELRPAQQTDKAIDEDAKKIEAACKELGVRLASEENAATDPKNVSQWNELSERVIKLKSDIRGRKVSEQAKQALLLFAQVEQVMGFPELKTMSNDEVEQKFGNEIAQLTQAVAELSGRFQAITTEASTFKNDADFIWMAPGYADVMERRDAWSRLNKNVLGTDLSDSKGQLADVQNRLPLLQSVMSWGSTELTNLVTRTTDAQQGCWDAELALSNARIRADRMTTGFKSLSHQFDLMGEFLQRQPKPRIEIDLSQASKNENVDGKEVVHYSAPPQSENDVDSVGSSFSDQSNVIQPVDEEEDFDLNENISLFSEVTKSSSDNQTDDLDSDDDVLHDVPTFDGTPGSDQHFLEVTNYSSKRLKVLANQSQMRTKAVIKLAKADKETVERLSRREQMALQMEAELEMIHRFLLLNAGSKNEAFVAARKKYDETRLLINVLWDEIGKAHERLGTTSNVLMMKRKTTTGDSGESTEYSESVSSKSDSGESTSSSDESDSSFSGSDDSMSQASSNDPTQPTNAPPKSSWRDRFVNPDKPIIEDEDYDTPPLPDEKTQRQKMGFAEASGPDVPIGNSQSMPKASAPDGITSPLEARYKAIRKKRPGGTGMGKRLGAIDSAMVNEYVRNGGAHGFLTKVTGPDSAKSDDERMLNGFRQNWQKIDEIVSKHQKEWTEKERRFFAQIQAEFATEIEFWKKKPCQTYVAKEKKKANFLNALTAQVMLNNSTLRQLYMQYAKTVEHNEEVVAAAFLWHDKKYKEATLKYGPKDLWNLGGYISKKLVGHFDGTKTLDDTNLRANLHRGDDQFRQMLWGYGGAFERFKTSDILKTWLERNL